MARYSVQYGGHKGKKYSLVESNDLVVVRTAGARPLSAALRSRQAIETLAACAPVMEFADAGVSVHRVQGETRVKSRRDAARGVLKEESGLQFAGRVLVESSSREPVLYTENLFIKFHDQVSTRQCRSILKAHDLAVKRQLPYAANAYFAGGKDGIGLSVFATSQELLKNESVEFCHPELVRKVRSRAAFPQQWHLKKTRIGGRSVDQHANVEAAWSLTQGEGVTIAVVDTGIDIDHAEFSSSGKIVAPRDVTRGNDDPRPRSTSENHGTACAGVACGDGMHGASGVAPRARLMPIRLMSGLGSQAEADAFVWAADHGAGVISCSWGPPDGPWWDDNHPSHDEVFPLPDSTRLAIDYAVDNGRGGKGCVICWAAGNGNESVDNDGYASYPSVISVAACSDSGKRSVYSDFGAANWCSFPSSTFGPPDPLTPGIWTTDQSGVAGYSDGDYADDFGGTSSSCPGAAGVAALVLARNPDLRWDAVKDILKRCCDQIDQAGGNYDAEGHSHFYGYGRLNAKQAVELATPSAAAYTAIHTAVQTVAIKDLKSSEISVQVGDSTAIQDVRIAVAMDHTWIGDLVVSLRPPAGLGVGAIVLHDRSGGGTQNLNRNYDVGSTPGLAQLQGLSPQGLWSLEVEDRAKRDTGSILRFSVELDL
jgi:subtilisin family serine protease